MDVYQVERDEKEHPEQREEDQHHNQLTRSHPPAAKQPHRHERHRGAQLGQAESDEQDKATG